jgi:glycolate oxidase iron-sulfur subunit
MVTAESPANPLREVLDKSLLKQCVHCGLCLDFCPTYTLLGHEADSPRGRIYQVRQVYEGRISPDNPDFRQHIYACLDCRACQTACPSGVQYGAIVEAARAVAPPPSPVERTIGRSVLGTVFMRKPLLEIAGFALRSYQRSGIQALVRRSGALRFLPTRLAETEALLGATQGGVVRWTPPPVMRPTGKVRYRVGFVEGCVMAQFFSETNRATLRVLLRNGCEVFSPPGQGCCGALHVHTGERQTARQLARNLVDSFQPLELDAIIVNAAGCGTTLKEYGHLLADDPAYSGRAAAFAARVKDVSEFLASIDLVPPTKSVKLKVTYQDPCHLAHGQAIRREPRRLLSTIADLELVEMKGADACCGGAGVYNLTHPELSREILRTKMENVAATGVQGIVASNPGCAMQLEYGASVSGFHLPVFHVVDLLDRAYGSG